MIVPDVNLLIHAMNAQSDHHERAWSWWSSAWNGTEHIVLAWSVLIGYVHITTHPRIMPVPQPFDTAINDVRSWMSAPISVMLTPGPGHLHVMDALMAEAGWGGDLTPDAHLAALAVENGGALLIARGRRGRKTLGMSAGDSGSIALQGAFLLVLDLSQARQLP